MKCKVQQVSFTAHTDVKGIMQLVGHLSPKNVVLVHGEIKKMLVLKDRIQKELRIGVYCPENNGSVDLQWIFNNLMCI